jgi:hypothetical protein
MENAVLRMKKEQRIRNAKSNENGSDRNWSQMAIFEVRPHRQTGIRPGAFLAPIFPSRT